MENHFHRKSQEMGQEVWSLNWQGWILWDMYSIYPFHFMFQIFFGSSLETSCYNYCLRRLTKVNLKPEIKGQIPSLHIPYYGIGRHCMLWRRKHYALYLVSDVTHANFKGLPLDILNFQGGVSSDTFLKAKK